MQHMDEFKTQKSDVQWHIKSDHVEEMASKSKVVSMYNMNIIILLLLMLYFLCGGLLVV